MGEIAPDSLWLHPGCTGAVRRSVITSRLAGVAAARTLAWLRASKDRLPHLRSESVVSLANGVTGAGFEQTSTTMYRFSRVRDFEETSDDSQELTTKTLRAVREVDEQRPCVVAHQQCFGRADRHLDRPWAAAVPARRADGEPMNPNRAW